LASSPNPSNAGQTVTFTVSVAVAGCQGTPPAPVTGNISFFDGAAQIGQSGIFSGIATLQSSTLAAGSHVLNARYSGDVNYSAITSSGVTQVVNGGQSTAPAPATTPTATATATTTALATSANPIDTTQSLTLTASVTPSGATGQVQFRDGATMIGTSALSGGAASFTASNLAAGTHTLTAVYVGDTNFNTSTSNTVNETVTAPSLSPGSSSTTLSVSPNPAVIGQVVTLSATVAPSNALGSVQFLDGATSLGQGDLVGGNVTFHVSSFTAGSHTLTARYLGDAATPPHPSSTSSPVTLTVTSGNGKQDTTITLTGSVEQLAFGASLSLKAFVTPAGATGDVQFTDSGSPLSIVALTNGVATLVISSLSIGSHSLAATYMGDANFNPSTSNPDDGLPATPSNAETAQAVVRAEGSSGPANTAGLKVTVLPVPSLSISAPTPSSTADQPVPRVTLSPAYALPLTARFTLSFTPDRANLPESYTNPDVKFMGGVTSETISIPANSSEPVLLPAIQLGMTAGTITVTLADLTTSAGLSVLPANPPAAAIPVGKFVPSIVPGSVRIVKNASSGLAVLLDASSTTCDLSSANLTVRTTLGGRLDRDQATVSLTAPAASWFPGAAANCGVADGGAFSLTIPFPYPVDTTAIGTVSVTLTNSAGTSTAVSGGSITRPATGTLATREKRALP